VTSVRKEKEKTDEDVKVDSMMNQISNQM